jgi:hypothetical protein
LWEDHRPRREAKAGGCRGDPSPLHEPQIDDLLADEAEAADGRSAQQCEAEQEHHA